MDWAVLLMAYGGPDSLEDIEPYLLDVRGGRATPPELVEEIRERYAMIGGRSPLLEITCAQALALESYLNRQGSGANHYKVFVGMRHWKPYIREAVEAIYRSGRRHIVALCMAPYYSKMSIGAYAEKLRRAIEEVQAGDGSTMDVRLVESWNTHPLFIDSMAAKLRAGLAKFPEEERDQVSVVFTAHSLPLAIMQQGDPYDTQFKETAGLVARALNLSDARWLAAYQSVGAQNTRWLGPDLEEVLERLAREGVKNVLVAPIGFVADHVEILYDIDIMARNLAGELGLRLERTESQNDSAAFIAALVDIVEKKALNER